MLEVVVLGSTGFIGRACVEHFLNRNDRNIRPVLGLRGSPRRLPTAIPAEMVLSYDDLASVRADALASADVIIDLISMGRGRAANRHDVRGRLDGHSKLLDRLADAQWGGLFVYISSGGAIYEAAPDNPCVTITDRGLSVAECAPLRPVTEYGYEKLAVESHLRYLNDATGFRHAVLRVANAYGPKQRAENGFGVIPRLFDAAYDGSPFDRYGDGTAIRDYVHVTDVVSALMNVTARATIPAERPGYIGSLILNIGSGIGTSVNQLVSMIEATTSKTISVRTHVPRYPEPAGFLLDFDRASVELDWRPNVNLPKGLSEMHAQRLERVK